MKLFERGRALLLAVVVLTAACADAPLAPSREGRVLVNFLTPATVRTVVVEVTGPGITPAIVLNIPVGIDSTARDTIVVTAGSGRRFTVTAFDSAGVATHRADTTISLLGGVNPPLAVRVVPLSSTLGLTVTFGGIRLTVVDTATRRLTIGESDTVSAIAWGADGAPIPSDSLVWGTSNPAIVTVARGAITALRPGSALISVGYRGASARIAVEVTDGGAPPSSDALLVSFPGISVRQLAASGDTAVFVLADLSSATTIAGTALAPSGLGTIPDLVVLKLGRNLVPQWAVHVVDATPETHLAAGRDGRAVLTATIDANLGAAIEVRHTGGSQVFSSSAKQDGLLWSLTAAGGLDWHVRLAAESNEGAVDLSVDDVGATYFAGVFNGCCPTGNTSLISSSGGSVPLAPIGFATGVLARLSPTGAVQWNARVGQRDAAFDEVATAPDGGRLFASAWVRYSSSASTLIDGAGASFTLPKPCVFEHCLHYFAFDPATGAQLWATAIEVNIDTYKPDMVVAGGAPYLGGRLPSSATFRAPGGGSPLVVAPPSGGDHFAIVRVDADGVPQSSGFVTATGELTAGQMIGLADGRVLLPSSFTGTLSSGSLSTAAVGSRDGALVVLGSGLTPQSILHLAGAAGTSNRLRAVAVAPDASLLVGGDAAAGATIGGLTVSTSGGIVYRRPSVTP